MKTKVKRNLYFEIKDRVIEERFNGMRMAKKKQKTKVYGLDSSHAVRGTLMEILRERMTYHKDKFVSPIIYSELETLEVKKNGKIEHSSNAHDDQVFSYLLALYVWYYGNNVMEHWNIVKHTITTDENLEDGVLTLEEKYDNILDDTVYDEFDDKNQVKEQLAYLNSAKTMSYEEFMLKQKAQDEEALRILMQNNPRAKAAYERTYANEYEGLNDFGSYQIPNEVFTSFNNDNF